MIANAVIRFFKAVFGFIVKAAAWLLFAFGLWLPCLFTVIFLIVCAFSATSFNSVLPQFFVGLAVSFVVGIALSYYIDKAKRKRKREVKRGLKDTHVSRVGKETRQSKNEPQVTDEYRRDEAPHSYEYDYRKDEIYDGFAPADESAPAYYEDETNESFDPYRPPAGDIKASPTPAQEGIIKRSSEKPVYDFRDEAELRGKFFEDEKKSRLGESRGYDFEASAKRRLDRLTYAEDEPPMIFRSRTDKNIYICEYADRLEYFERTAWGEMKRIDVRYKSSF